MAMVTGFGQGTSTFASPTKKQTEMSKSTHPSGMNRPNEWVGKTAETFEKQQATPQPVQNPQLQSGAVTPQDPKKARDTGDDTLQKVAQTNLSNLGTFGLAVQGAVNRFTNQGKGVIGSSGGVNVKFDPTTKAWTMEDTLAAEQGTLTSDKQAEQKALGGVLDEWYEGEAGDRKAIGFREGLEREAERLKQHYPDVESKTQYLLGLSDRLAMLEDQGLGNSAEARSIRQSISLEDDKGLVKMLYDARKKYKDVVTGVTGEGQTWSGDGFGEYSALDLESLTKDQIESEMKNAMVGQMGLFAGDYALNVKNQMDQMREEYLNAGNEDLKRQQALQKAAQDWLDSQKDEMEGNKDEIDDAFNDAIDELDKDLQGGGGDGEDKPINAWESAFGSDRYNWYGPATPEAVASYDANVKKLVDADKAIRDNNIKILNEQGWSNEAIAKKQQSLKDQYLTPLQEWLKDTTKPIPEGIYANLTPEEVTNVIENGGSADDLAYLNAEKVLLWNKEVDAWNEKEKYFKEIKDKIDAYATRIQNGETLTQAESDEYLKLVGAHIYGTGSPEGAANSYASHAAARDKLMKSKPIQDKTISPSAALMGSKKKFDTYEDYLADLKSPYSEKDTGFNAVLEEYRKAPVSTNMAEYGDEVNNVQLEFHQKKAVGATTAPDPIAYYMSLEMLPRLRGEAEHILKYGGSYLTPMGLITHDNAESFLQWQRGGYQGDWTQGKILPGMEDAKAVEEMFNTPIESLPTSNKHDTYNTAIIRFKELLLKDKDAKLPDAPYPGLTMEETKKAYDAGVKQVKDIREAPAVPTFGSPEGIEYMAKNSYEAAVANNGGTPPPGVTMDTAREGAKTAVAATQAFSDLPTLEEQWIATQAYEKNKEAEIKKAQEDADRRKKEEADRIAAEAKKKADAEAAARKKREEEIAKQQTANKTSSISSSTSGSSSMPGQNYGFR